MYVFGCGCFVGVVVRIIFVGCVGIGDVVVAGIVISCAGGVVVVNVVVVLCYACNRAIVLVADIMYVTGVDGVVDGVSGFMLQMPLLFLEYLS